MYVEQVYKKTQENLGKNKAFGKSQRADLQKLKTYEITVMKKNGTKGGRDR